MQNFSLLIYPVAARTKVAQVRKREKEKQEYLKRELKALESKGAGVLYWRTKHNKLYFWESRKNKQRGITLNQNKIYSLARLKYLRLRFNGLRNINEDRWKNMLDSLIESFEKANLELSRILLTKEQYEWALSPQSENPLYRENLKYKTTNGVLVRSKSEQAIGNMLELLGVPYRYEPEMILGSRVFYPDFVIMTTDGRKIILEHLGRMDIEAYAKSVTEKLMVYASNGWLPGRNVFFSFESDTQDPEKIKSIIYDILAA